VVPIGEAFPGMVPLVVDEGLNEVMPGQDGELLMTGPQLSLGYWSDPAKTAVAFVRPPGRSEIYYRTGDRVRKSGNGPLLYLGRIDSQIKILGHRVELGEVEAVVREESRIDALVALAWPKTEGGAGGVEVFLESEAPPTSSDLKERVAARLPTYMVPRRYHYLPQLPLNTNGKYDRQALTRYLEKHSPSIVGVPAPTMPVVEIVLH
jgi:acyl-coenzyme A synthetase/AMP-(fatty) acid ligase